MLMLLCISIHKPNFSLDFKNFNFQRSEQSKGWNCITIPNFVEIALTVAEISRFLYFKMVLAAILDFRNFEFLTVGRVMSVELRHRAKFRRNRSNRDRDM